MDLQIVERFILHGYKESSVVWISSIWKIVLIRGLLRFILIAFVWLSAFMILMVENIDITLGFFLIFVISLAPITTIVATIYHKQIIMKGSGKISSKFNLLNPLEHSFTPTSIKIGVAVAVAPLLTSRIAPEMYSTIFPIISFILAIVAGILGHLILFQVCGQFYKIYLIKKYCPYLRTPADARYPLPKQKARDED